MSVKGTSDVKPLSRGKRILMALIIVGGFAAMLTIEMRKSSTISAPTPSPAPVVEPVEVAGAPGSYYFPATGDAWMVARHAFEVAHPELACEYSGVQESPGLDGVYTSTYARGHYLVCKNIAVDAESVTVP